MEVGKSRFSIKTMAALKTKRIKNFLMTGVTTGLIYSSSSHLIVFKPLTTQTLKSGK